MYIGQLINETIPSPSHSGASPTATQFHHEEYHITTKPSERSLAPELVDPPMVVLLVKRINRRKKRPAVVSR